MKQETQLKIRSMFKYPWFQSCGEPLPDTVTQVKTWQWAVKTCNSRKWENCCLMARNALSWSVQTQSWHRAQDWNGITVELRTVITDLLNQSIRRSSISEEYFDKIKGTISWDVMLICMEVEFNDLKNPNFYLPYLDLWYSSGHFPCGWDGAVFPEHWDGIVREGKLFVY